MASRRSRMSSVTVAMLPSRWPSAQMRCAAPSASSAGEMYVREASAASCPVSSAGATRYPIRRPGATVFENDEVKITRTGPASSNRPGSGSPSKRRRPYGSSSRMVKPCRSPSAASARRLSRLSVAPDGFWKLGIVYSSRAPAVRARPGQGVDVHAVGLHRDREHLEAVAPHLEQRAVVGRGLHRHQVAGREQRVEQEDEPLEGPVGHEHPVGAHAVPGGEPFAQRRVALARAVGEQPHAVIAQGRGRALGDQGRVEGLGAGGAAGERDGSAHEAGFYRPARATPSWRAPSSAP